MDLEPSMLMERMPQMDSIWYNGKANPTPCRLQPRLNAVEMETVELLTCLLVLWFAKPSIGYRIGQAPGWYEPPLSSPAKPPTTYLFWLNHVLCGDIQLESGSITKKPGRGALVSKHNKLAPYKLKLVNKQWMDELQFEKTVREKLEHVPVVIVDGEEETNGEEMDEQNDGLNEQEIEGLIPIKSHRPSRVSTTGSSTCRWMCSN
jgi:hypothetical protein